MALSAASTLTPHGNFSATSNSTHPAGILEFRVLGSGSSGNALLIRTPTSALLVDAGLSAKKLSDRLAECGISPAKLDGILLTHEHQDHTAGLELFQKRFGLPLFANRLTVDALRHAGCSCLGKVSLFITGHTFTAGSMHVRSFSVPHDAADPVGFVIEAAGARLAILTDLGKPTLPVTEAIRGAHAIFLEANYDKTLLERDPKRPWSVKQRISGPHGHLSNTAAGLLLSRSATSALGLIVLGHLSEDCNSPELASAEIRRALRPTSAAHAAIFCAPRRDPSPWWHVPCPQ